MSDTARCARPVKPFAYCERCLRNIPAEPGQWQVLPNTDPITGDCLDLLESDD